VPSECYSGKRRAFGLGAMKRGGHGKRRNSKGTPGDVRLVDDASDSDDEWTQSVLEAVSVDEWGDEEYSVVTTILEYTSGQRVRRGLRPLCLQNSSVDS
jgi:hypothetical protein